MKNTALSFRRLPCQGKNETFLLTGMVLYSISEKSEKDFSRNGQRLFFYRRPATALLWEAKS
mgnify:CR=1 FL=1